MKSLAEALDSLMYAVVETYRTEVESPIEAMLVHALYRDLGYCRGTGALSRARLGELRSSIGGDGAAAWVFTQHPIGRYRADLLIIAIAREACALVVECDGKEFHSSPDQIARDDQRDWEMRQAGLAVLRFSGSEIYTNTNGVLAQIVAELGSVGQDVCRSTGKYPRPVWVDRDEVDCGDGFDEECYCDAAD